MRGMFDISCRKCGKKIGWSGNLTNQPNCPKCGFRPPQDELNYEQEKMEKEMKAAKEQDDLQTQYVKEIENSEEVVSGPFIEAVKIAKQVLTAKNIEFDDNNVRMAVRIVRSRKLQKDRETRMSEKDDRTPRI